MVAEHKLTSKGASLGNLELALKDRMLDLEVLLIAKRYSAAISAGLYALEIRLKVKICRNLNLDFLPRAFEIHDLDGLLILTGLNNVLNGDRMRKSPVKRNWDQIRTASSKLSELRYLPDTKTTENEAKTFVYQLTDEKNGVLPWLSNSD